MSSKSIHRTSNKKFSDFMQLSNQYYQIKICEVSHFCIILELVAYNFFLLKETGICVTKTTRNAHFSNVKFTWKKLIHAQNVFSTSFSSLKRQLVICVTC